MKGSEVIAKILKAEGVEILTCFPHSSVIDSAAALGIRPVVARTERVAVNIADGYTRMTGGRKIGVCTVQFGPGVENSFGAVAQAFGDSTPILHLAGGYRRHYVGVCPNFEAARNFKLITKWAETFNAVDRMPQMMRSAFAVLRSASRGPVLLETPRDLMDEEIPDDSFDYQPQRLSKAAADPEDVRAVADALLAAACPVIVAGEIEAVREEFMKAWMPRLTADEEPISPYRVIWEVMQTVDRTKTVVTHDAGNPRDQTAPFYEAIVPHGYMGWGKTTQLGTGLGLIMGAKLARPDWLAINIMGDAAFGMVGMDFETAVRNQIGIITIVFNNSLMGGYSTQHPIAAERYHFQRLSGDYCKVAEALGAYSERVVHVDDLRPALERAIQETASGRPALLDVKTAEEPNFPTG